MMRRGCGRDFIFSERDLPFLARQSFSAPLKKEKKL